MPERTFRVPGAIATMGFVVSWVRRACRSARAWRASSEERQARRQAILFYVIVLVALASLSLHTLATTLRLGAPPRAAAFGVLMLLHGYLHWRSPLLSLRPRLALPYLAAQGGLATALVVFSGNPGLAFGLFPVLIGVTAGTVGDRRLGGGAAVAYLLSGLWTLSALLGPRDFSKDAPMMALTSLFAAFFALSYRRQADAEKEARSLLGKLTEAHDRLAEYALRVEDLTIAAERQRMARELHDTLAQGVAGLILQIEAAAGHLADQHTERTSAILQHALVRARQTLADARQAIDGLREVGAGSRDLGAAIRSEADRFTRASGVPCRLELTAATEVEPETCEQALRIVAEALGNVARHAQAHAVAVSAACEGQQIAVAVEDDGGGFDVALEDGRAGHYGLIGMRERARLVDGSLRVDSAPGRGTRVELRLPKRRPQENG